MVFTGSYYSNHDQTSTVSNLYWAQSQQFDLSTLKEPKAKEKEKSRFSVGSEFGNPCGKILYLHSKIN